VQFVKVVYKMCVFFLDQVLAGGSYAYRCVQFVCQEGHGDFLFSIDERETCAYIVTVHTSRICAHPSFGPPASIESLPISCNPLLSADDYEVYVKGTFQVSFAFFRFTFAVF